MTAPSTLRLLRRRPPAATLAWVANSVAPGSTIGRVWALGHATARGVHAVTLVAGARKTVVILRRFVPTPESVMDADMNVAREQLVLELIARSEIHAPRALAADPDGTRTDVPAIVLDRLPGHPPIGVPDLPQLLAGLAEIHAFDAEAASSLPPHRRWNDPATTEVPPWGTDAKLWRVAIETARTPAPPSQRGLVHGDFHAGNTLWSRGRLTGIVDWTAASFGPRAVDLAQLRWNLAITNGPEVAGAALAEASRAGVEREPYWDIATVVDLLPDINPSRPPPPLQLARLESFLRSAIDSL